MDGETRTERLKRHLSENRGYYICGAVALAGITWPIVKGKNPALRGGAGSALRGGAEGIGGSTVDNTVRSSLFNFLGKTGDVNTVNNSYTSIHTGNRGSSGFVTRCIETGELFQTQKVAAQVCGIPESLMSGHLNKGLELEEGLHFERVGVLS